MQELPVSLLLACGVLKAAAPLLNPTDVEEALTAVKDLDTLDLVVLGQRLNEIALKRLASTIQLLLESRYGVKVATDDIYAMIQEMLAAYQFLSTEDVVNGVVHTITSNLQKALR